jgi:hypothetical protein
MWLVNLVFGSIGRAICWCVRTFLILLAIFVIVTWAFLDSSAGRKREK